ncbi:MAG: LPP20 family lipoprotein [Thermodesulfobacteriota bacterium]
MTFAQETEPILLKKRPSPCCRTAGAMACLMLCLLFWICGCGSTRSEGRGHSDGAAPASVSSRYRPAEYLTAKGTGQSEPEARRRAMAALSNIFESEIASELQTRTQSVIDSQKGDRYEKRVAETVQVKSAVRLQGAKIGKTWQTDGRWHAIAVLHRARARDQWISEIEHIDDKMAGQIKAYRELESPILQLQAIDRIMTRWIEKQVIESRLRVIGARYNSPAAPDIKALVKKRPKIKSRMRIFAAISGSRAQTIRDEIVRRLTSEGYVFTDRKQAADVVIDGKTEVKPIDMNRQDWEFVRAIITVSVSDAATGDQVSRITENTRAAHLNIDEATRKAIEQVSGDVAEKIGKQFVTTNEKNTP